MRCSSSATAVVALSRQRSVLRAAAFFDGEELLAETRAAIAAHAPPHLTSAARGAATPVLPPHIGDGEGITVQ